MSSLAELPELVGFFSYSREDDEDSQGALSALRDRIQRELRVQLGRSTKTFRLWQDKEAIASGKLWEEEIKTAVGQAVFFIPIITPTVVRSPYCRFELEAFLAREAELGRGDLVFPILYVQVPELEDIARQKNDPVLSIIAKRQYLDWRELRHRDVHSENVKEMVARFCAQIGDALRQSWVSPEERRQQEAEAQRQAEDERQRREAEAKRRAKEEKRQRVADEERRKREAEIAQRSKEEAEAKRREEEELKSAEVRRRAEEERAKAEARRKAAEEAEARQQAEQERAEVKRRAAEVESRRKAEAEALERAETERARKEEEAKRREEQAQEQAFAAAKRADSINVIDMFIASHPESRYANEAHRLRAALMARDDAFKVAMATDDTATLKVFLQTYPKGALADQVRGRLRGLEPQRTSRLLLIGGCLLGLALIIGFVTWPWVIRTSDDAGSVATKLKSDVSVVATQTDVTDAPHSQPLKPDTTAATQTGNTGAPHSQPLSNDATNGNQVTILRGHVDLVLDAAFSPDGARIVTASQDNDRPHLGRRLRQRDRGLARPSAKGGARRVQP